MNQLVTAMSKYFLSYSFLISVVVEVAMEVVGATETEVQGRTGTAIMVAIDPVLTEVLRFGVRMLY